MKPCATNGTDSDKMSEYSISKRKLQHAYDIARIKLAEKYDRRNMYSTDVKRYIGLNSHESMISHVVNGNGTSKRVLTEVLKMIYHIDSSLLPAKVVEELQEEGHLKGLENEFPHADFIKNINKTGKEG